MIGVDIIDLSHSFHTSKHTFAQYKKKILNTAEYSFCENLLDLQFLWAMKESVYKCNYKVFGAFFINPKRILITQFSSQTHLFTAAIGEVFYTGRLYSTAEYVYAICGPLDTEFDNNLVFIEQNNHKPTAEVELDYYFNKRGAPPAFALHQEGFPVGIRVENRVYAYSRSHHGAYYISVIHLGAYN